MSGAAWKIKHRPAFRWHGSCRHLQRSGPTGSSAQGGGWTVLLPRRRRSGAGTSDGGSASRESESEPGRDPGRRDAPGGLWGSGFPREWSGLRRGVSGGPAHVRSGKRCRLVRRGLRGTHDAPGLPRRAGESPADPHACGVRRGVPLVCLGRVRPHLRARLRVPGCRPPYGCALRRRHHRGERRREGLQQRDPPGIRPRGGQLSGRHGRCRDEHVRHRRHGGRSGDPAGPGDLPRLRGRSPVGEPGGAGPGVVHRELGRRRGGEGSRCRAAAPRRRRSDPQHRCCPGPWA